MVRSMTGFGRSEYADTERKITVEMKSVNNRYLDFNLRMPRKFNCFEARIRSVIQQYMERGKVDIFINYYDYSENAAALHFNELLADEYIAGLRKIGEKEGVESRIMPVDVARFPEVFSMEEQAMDEDAVWACLEGALREAAAAFRTSREVEGEYLKENILEKLQILYDGAVTVERHEPEIAAAYRAKLDEKLSELLGDTKIDEGRLAQEVVLFADRISTDEECVRLKSHVEKMRAELAKDESIGRSLDFLAQEMNREANTMLSKAGDVITSDVAISLKTVIEKIREQIQNIE